MTSESLNMHINDPKLVKMMYHDHVKIINSLLGKPSTNTLEFEWYYHMGDWISVTEVTIWSSSQREKLSIQSTLVNPFVVVYTMQGALYFFSHFEP